MADNISRGIMPATWANEAALVAKSPNSRKKKQVEDPVVTDVINDFDAAWQYCKGSWHSRWEDNHNLYNGNRVKRDYDGITDTFVPMCFSTVETMVSALFGTKPKFTYLPPQERQDQKTDILNSLLDFYWDKDQWSLKIINTGRSMLKLGTSVDYFIWDRDHPKLINVPIRDFFIDPMATSLENARYMGRRYLTTKKELEGFEVIDLDNPVAVLDEMGMPVINPETGEPEVEYQMKKKYRNLDKIRAGKTNENTDKQEKDLWYGSTIAQPEKEQVEIIEYWTMDKTISVANREVVIEDSENYYKAKARANGDEFPEGLMPFADARDYVDESLFYAKGEIDFIADEQELLNDITNQNVDAVTYTLNQMYALDPAYAHLIKEIENLPGAVYPVPPEALQPIMQRPIPPDAFRERQNLKNEIRETTASNEIVKGVKAEGGKTTATEINAQIAGAGQRINLKVTQLENGYFHRVARIVFAMIKLYVTEPMMVRIMGSDGARWEEFDPSEFKGDYEPRVQLDISVENKKQEQAVQAKELMASFLGDPDINQQELKKLALQRGFGLDPDEVETLMQPPMINPLMAGGSLDSMAQMMSPAEVPLTNELSPLGAV